MPLYTAVLFFSILIPLILSFDKKVSFFRIWRSLLPASLIVGSVYIIVDIVFVRKGVWGFNPVYHSTFVFYGLPLEEWLFFILIPYASLFIHYVFIVYFPDLLISEKLVRFLSVAIIFFLLPVVFMNYDKAYTFFNFSLLIIALLWALIDKSGLLNRYFLSFLIILIPFFIVNSILTGTFIKGEVVWYNNSETLGIRLGTVPIEDVGYAFSLMLLNLLINNRLQRLLKPEHRYFRNETAI
jgi:lycopene cyclase domain-containing protein